MAKIILVWNTHPNESAVTLPLARLLKKDLEKRGHRIEIKENPRHGHDYSYPAEVLIRYSGAFVIDLHTQLDWFLLSNKRGTPKRLQIDYSNELTAHIENKRGPYIMRGRGNERVYYLEFPEKPEFQKRVEYYSSDIVIRRIGHAIDRVVKSPKKFDKIVETQKKMSAKAKERRYKKELLKNRPKAVIKRTARRLKRFLKV